MHHSKKFKTSEQLRESVQLYSKIKNRVDQHHRDKVKETSKTKLVIEQRLKRYNTDIIHKEKVQSASYVQYKTSEAHTQQLKNYVYAKRRKNREDQKNWTFVQEEIRNEMKMYPDHVCSVCYKLLIRKQVLICEPQKIQENTRRN